MQESDYRHPHLVPNDLFDIVVEVLEWAKFISETRDVSDQKNMFVIGLTASAFEHLHSLIRSKDTEVESMSSVHHLSQGWKTGLYFASYPYYFRSLVIKSEGIII